MQIYFSDQKDRDTRRHPNCRSLRWEARKSVSDSQGIHISHFLGEFWKPVFNILENDFEVIVVNAQHISKVPGRKTDQSDAE